MLCHAGPFSLEFLAGCLILRDSDLQIQIFEEWIAAYTEATSTMEIRIAW